MMDTRKFADKVGRRRIAEALGVGATAVSNHVVNQRFPASWFLALQELASAEGVECPPEMFGMKSLSNSSPSADAPSQEAS